jgi:transcriptional regulator with XRE-family HTH domain
MTKSKSKKITEQRFKEQFAKRLRVVCAARNVSGKKLAGQIGVSSRNTYDYLNGKSLPGAFNLALICQTLEVDAGELLGVKVVDE